MNVRNVVVNPPLSLLCMLVRKTTRTVRRLITSLIDEVVEAWRTHELGGCLLAVTVMV